LLSCTLTLSSGSSRSRIEKSKHYKEEQLLLWRSWTVLNLIVRIWVFHTVWMLKLKSQVTLISWQWSFDMAVALFRFRGERGGKWHSIRLCRRSIKEGWQFQSRAELVFRGCLRIPSRSGLFSGLRISFHISLQTTTSSDSFYF